MISAASQVRKEAPAPLGRGRKKGFLPNALPTNSLAPPKDRRVFFSVAAFFCVGSAKPIVFFQLRCKFFFGAKEFVKKKKRCTVFKFFAVGPENYTKNVPFFRPLPKGAGASLRTYEAALIKLRFIYFLLIIYFSLRTFFVCYFITNMEKGVNRIK